VTQGRIENLAALFARTWQRPPTVGELRALVDEYVLEEALFREGVALGVDQGDTVIRRRVRQKMDFFVDDLLDTGESPEAELEAWLAEHPDSYAQPARFTFRQVYLNLDRRGDALRSDAERLLEELRSADGTLDPRELGDGSLLGYAYEDSRADTIASSFGQVFAEDLATLPTSEWSGPVESAFGLHLVFIDASTPGRLPALAEVRAEVERDWRFAQREEASKLFYEQVVSRYDVTVEWPQVSSSTEGAQAREVIE
jgi:parvulin-like peptidyl-prolyl isomerase